MMRGVDRRLEEALGRIQEVTFLREAHIGSAISEDPWVRIARRQAREYVPDATVVFIGANDGFNFRRARCCGKKWVRTYEDRVRQIIRAYSRGGRAQVYWLTMPAARSGRRRELIPLINGAIRRAVRASGAHAHLVDAWALFTPGGLYRHTMEWKGQQVVIRNEDGVHLGSPGPIIAADLIRDVMLEDGILP